MKAMNAFFSRACGAMTEFFLGAAIIGVPLFFVPLFSYSLDRGRQFLFVMLIIGATVSYVLKSMADREVIFTRHPAFIAGAVMVLFAIFSTVTNGHWHGHLVGLNGEAHLSLISLCSFFVFFYLVSILARKPFFVERMIVYSVCSGYVLLFLVACALVGAPFISFLFGDGAFSLLTGATDQFSFFLLMLINASLVLFFHADQFTIPVVGRMVLRCLLVVVSAAGAAVLLLLGNTASIIMWLVSAVSIIIYFIFFSSQFKTKWLVYPMTVVAIVAVLLVSNLPWRFPSSYTPRPPFDFSLEVLVSALHDRPFFGFGTASYTEIYGTFAPQEGNTTPLWNAQFSAGHSDGMTIVSERGAVGFAAWLAMQVALIVVVIRLLWRSKQRNTLVGVYVFASWCVLFIAHFFFVFSFTTEMLWWLHAALLVGITLRPHHELKIEKQALPTVLGVMLVALVLAGGITARFFIADYFYARAINEKISSDAAVVYLNRAREFAHRDDRILRALSQSLLTHFKMESNAQPPSTRLGVLAKSAIEVSKEAMSVHKNDVRNTLAHVDAYMIVAPFATGAPAQAVELLTVAIKQAPNNPTIFYALGIAQRSLYEDMIKNGADKKAREPLTALISAESALREALLLKENYAEVYRALGQVYVLKEDTKKAVAALEKYRQLNPLDGEGALELALVYISDNQKQKAALVLDEIIHALPNYSNALWYRALLFAEEKNRGKAREYLERILKLNPTNETVKLQLERLQ